MKPRVWLQTVLLPEALAQLQEVAEVTMQGREIDLPGVTAVVINSLVNANGAFMDRMGPHLKVIARPGIGVDNVNREEASERGILIIHTPDTPTESTAEHAVALLLAVAKRVITGDMSLRGTATIERSQLLGTEVRGRTLGVVGFGRIGSRVAKICRHGLEMRVVVYDPYLADRSRAAALEVEVVDSLEAVLTQADFLTLHTALTPESRHLIGERELRMMKPGSYLINASRGPVVDELALIRVLEDGHLAGAGLDVFDPEPPLPGNPLLKMTNVVVTPHSAAYTDRSVQITNQGIVDQLLQIFRGERPTFLVNPEAWPGRVAH
jgi:D-3-phosphoglycerate dehydrogenase